MSDSDHLKNDFKDKYLQTKLYYELFQHAQDITCDANISLLGLSESIMTLLNDSEYAKRLRNKMFKAQQPIIDTPVYLSKTQLYWEKRILKSLNTMCTELNIPLSKKRSTQDIQEMKRFWNELGTNVSDLSKFRPVYAPKDFLEVVLGIKNTNLTDFAAQFNTGLIQVPLTVKSISQIKNEFSSLTLEYTQNGLIENLNSPMDIERIKIGQKVIDIGDLLLARQYSKQGCATSQRVKLWSLMLNVQLDELDIFYYNYLKQCVFEYDLLVDSLYYKDVKLTAVNDDQLFVFEDYLYQVLLLFSRDTQILKCFQNNGANPPKSFIKGHTTEKYTVTYPPNGVIPFHGFSMLVAPICYVYNDPILLYYMFREFYMTHFHKLNIISSDPQGIVGLCYLFETLLQSKDPELFFHLREIQAQPLRIAFKWIMRAFSGFLASNQLLELWDRILAFNSLEILSIFAVGVFLYRKQNIMIVNNDVNVDAIFNDLTSLKVIPILQLVLL